MFMRKRSSCEEDRHYQDVENKKLHVLSGFWTINLNLFLLHVSGGDSILLNSIHNRHQILGRFLFK